MDRIGAEVDRRVDARLAQHGRGRAPAPARGSWTVLPLALGSTVLGIGAAGVILAADGRGGSAALVAFIWLIIGVINVSHSRRH